jgi:hypothetical protein
MYRVSRQKNVPWDKWKLYRVKSWKYKCTVRNVKKVMYRVRRQNVPCDKYFSYPKQ